MGGAKCSDDGRRAGDGERALGGDEVAERVAAGAAAVQGRRVSAPVDRGASGRERERGRDAQEGVAERHLADVLHVGVVDKVAVDEEEDGEVDLFAGEEALLLEAEALDLGKVRRDLRGRERRQSK